jgi:hypothetical protein
MQPDPPSSPRAPPCANPPPIPHPRQDYGKVRSDPNLVKLRESPKFSEVLDKYDEPVINWGAIQGTFGAFGKLFNKN